MTGQRWLIIYLLTKLNLIRVCTSYKYLEILIKLIKHYVKYSLQRNGFTCVWR